MEKLRRLVAPKLEEGPAEEVVDRSPKTVEDFDARIAEIESGLVAFTERIKAHREKGEERDLELFDQAMNEQIAAMQVQIEELKTERQNLIDASRPQQKAA
jgi:hypothetical protein